MEDDLVAYLDGELDAAQTERMEAALAADPRLAERLAGLCRQRLMLAEVAMAVPVSARPAVKPVHWRMPRGWPLAAAAALVLGVGATALWRFGPGNAGDYRVVMIDGSAEVARMSGNTQAAVIDDALKPGDGLSVRAHAQVTLRARDGSILTLGEDARDSRLALALRAGGGRSLTLAVGTLAVEASPQPADAPMVVNTPQVTVTVTGTRFTVAVDDQGSRVGVEHGAVRVTDRADGSVSDLKAGESTRWPHPLSVAAEADTYVVGAEPSGAHGDESVLQISAEADRSAPRRIAFIRFTVPSAPTRAVLHLRVVAAGDGGHVSLAAGTPWDEHHVNFYHVPAFAYPLAIFGPAAVGDDVAVDISAIIRQAGTVTLAVTSAVGGMSFASRETSDGPTLTLTSGASP